MSANNVRPETMERITTEALAKAFIDEQIAELRAQIGDGKVLLALSGVSQRGGYSFCRAGGREAESQERAGL